MEEIKIPRITAIYKGGVNIVNYRPISVMQCFSEVLKIIMYNRLYLCLTENNLLYDKEFCLQKGHSTDHCILQLADQILEMFN